MNPHSEVAIHRGSVQQGFSAIRFVPVGGFEIMHQNAYSHSGAFLRTAETLLCVMRCTLPSKPYPRLIVFVEILFH